MLTYPKSDIGEQIAVLNARLAQYKSSIRHLFSARRRGGETTGPALRRREDFNALTAALEDLERTLRKIDGKNQRKYFMAHSAVVGLFVVLIVTLAAAVLKFERHRTENLRTLEKTNRRLNAEIEEREKAQQALKASESLFRDVFRTIPEAIVISRLSDGLILDVNEGFAALTGYGQPDVVGNIVEDLHLWRHPGGRKKFIEALDKTGAVRNLATRFVTRGGSVKSVLLSSKIITLNDEPHILTVTRDITEIREAEARLKKSEEKFRSFFEASADLIHLLDPEGRVLMTNPAALARLRYPETEIIGRKLEALMPRPSAESFREHFRSLSGGGFHRGEYDILARDGRVVCVDGSMSIIRDETGETTHVIIFQKDITERKLAERKLKASHSFLVIANRHTKMTPALDGFTAEIRTLTDCRAVAVRVMDESGGVPYAASHGFGREFCLLEQGNPDAEKNTGMCMHILNGTVPPTLPYLTAYGSFHHNQASRFWGTASEYERDHLKNACSQFGFESLALIPIRSGGRTIGLIHVADKRENKVPGDIVDILEGAAMQLGSTIQRIRAEEALKASHDLLEKKVHERTDALMLTNLQLQEEIERHRKTEASLLQYQDQLRTLSAELLKTEERERRRIASEIHDRIGQTLAITKIQLGALRAAADDDKTLAAVDAIRDLITQTIKDTRSLTFELSPPVLYELGLFAALQWLAGTLGEQSGLAVKVDQNIDDEAMLDSNTRELLFRNIRELLLNVVKHARATQAAVSLRFLPDRVEAVVSDDGVGFPTDETDAAAGGDKSLGFGLFSIQEQLNHHGGRSALDSSPGGGTRVTIEVPLNATGFFQNQHQQGAAHAHKDSGRR